MPKSEAQRIESETLRKLQHLLGVQSARVRVITAERHFSDMDRQARSAGCTPDEIAAAVRIVERAK